MSSYHLHRHRDSIRPADTDTWSLSLEICTEELQLLRFIDPPEPPEYVEEDIEVEEDVEEDGSILFFYSNGKDNEKYYYDLDEEWSHEAKKLYAALIVVPNAEKNTRPSNLALEKEPKGWMMRRLLVERQQLDISKELYYAKEAMEQDPKNYEIWQHRRWIALKRGTKFASEEFEFTQMLIDEDASNFLVWSHRQWVFQVLGGDWEHELAYCDTVLRKDISNGFAWDQRYFVVTSSPTLGGMEAMREKEVDYALQAIAAKPWSGCPWTYIKRLYADDSKSLLNNRRVEDTCLLVLNGYNIDNVDRSAIDACANALSMGSHLIKLGLRTCDKWIAVIEDLTGRDSEFANRVGSTLQLARCDVKGLLSSLC